MNETEIQSRLSTLVTEMTRKGLVRPRVDVWLQADQGPAGYMRWEDAFSVKYDKNESRFYNGTNATDVLDKMFNYVHSLPDPETLRVEQFNKALAFAIEVGKANGIDVDYVNPLEKAMLALSENALAAPIEEDS